MEENSSSLYSEHHNYTMMPFTNYSLSSGIFNNIPCEDDGGYDGGDAQKSSLGFMELLSGGGGGGVPDQFGSFFDSPDHFLHPVDDHSPSTTTTNKNNNTKLLPGSPNSSSISSSSIEATTCNNNTDEQAKSAADDHVVVDLDDEENKKQKQLVLKPKKKNNKKQREARVAFMTKSEVDHLEDGYRWRKYGQKAVKNSPYPRSYYRCTNATCGVKKRVERSCTDSAIVVTTYEGQHTHPSPMVPRGGFAAATGVSHHPLTSASYGSGIASLVQMNATHNYLQQTYLHSLPLVVPQYHLSLGTSSVVPSQSTNNILLGPDQRSSFRYSSAFQGDHGLLEDVLPFDRS